MSMSIAKARSELPSYLLSYSIPLSLIPRFSCQISLDSASLDCEPHPQFPSFFAINAGFCSMVAEMKPLNAAQRFAVETCAGAGPPSVVVAWSSPATPSCPPAAPISTSASTGTSRSATALSRARLSPNLSTSPLTTRSFLLSAPLRLFKLRCRTLPSRSCLSPSSVSPSSSKSGRALASESRSATSFLPGRRRFRGFLLLLMWLAFWMRETKEACLTWRLSFLESMNESLVSAASGRGALRGAYGCAPDLAACLARRERRFEGTTGACLGFGG
ncbi:hypothetical protein GGR54DRAFT_282621 [Hypoxylon sp. NC1633]|nr:hypothetical protein GGR54DRAFT_282621 [Hypoxylon sp. NC1633]